MANPFVEKNGYEESHGTAVAGIIGAVARNGIGVSGIAPNVKISAYQFIPSPFSMEILEDELKGDFDIQNNSHGMSCEYSHCEFMSNLDLILEDQAKNARQGRGKILVRAAGNEFGYELDSNTSPTNTTPYQIIVGAMNALGKKSSYSSVGANLWISAPGGEYGFGPKNAIYDTPEIQPAILSTDLTGCNRGYSINNKAQEDISDFNFGLDTRNSNCDYTNIPSTP